MEKYHENKTPRDSEYVQAYLKTHSQIKAAKECGVSRETIARAVRRSGIQLDGRKYNIGSNNGQLKITDEELIRESAILNGFQIAQKYNIDIVNIFRRAKKLGLKIKVDGNKWKDRCKRYGVNDFDETITLELVIKKYDGICQLCGKPVDKSDMTNGHIGRLYPTVDHILPISKGGSHTWKNVQLAHMYCNSSKCDRYTVKREGAWT
jgi:5-methylcytosine-specific restriction endonuclease McrA